MTSPSTAEHPGAPTWRTAARAVRHGIGGVVWWFDSVLGGRDYQRYVAYRRRAHPGCPIPSEREYWRERHADAERNPASRCC